MALSSSQIESIKLWLMSVPHLGDGGLSFAQSLAETLKSKGLSVWRISFTLNTMHPEVLWRTLIWEDAIGSKFIDRPHSQVSQSIYIKSPIPALRDGGPPLYIPLDTDELPYPICEDLRQEGGRAYFAFGLSYSFGERGYISLTTKDPGGFHEDEQNALLSLAPFLARRIELESSYHLTHSLLQVYLGKSGAEKVIRGSFKRGQGELISAAIWFCDLRGFSELAEKHSPEQLVQKLDRYFEVVTDSITQNGGDVLKFIGDAVLAVFELKTQGECPYRGALKAAKESLEKLQRHADPDLNIGIALHVGEVLFGNVGGRERLDFTVISSAVNETARLEALCKELKTQLILSETFLELAELDKSEFVDLGVHKVKGVQKPLHIFTV